MRGFGLSACPASPEGRILHRWHSRVRGGDPLHRHHSPFRTHQLPAGFLARGTETVGRVFISTLCCRESRSRPRRQERDVAFGMSHGGTLGDVSDSACGGAVHDDRLGTALTGDEQITRLGAAVP
jgi:hypothetical protein